MEKEEFLLSCFEKIGVTLNKRQACQFLKYYDMLIEWNNMFNLTSITEYEDVCIKHFVDSCSLVFAYNGFEKTNEFFSGKSLVDVGSGAGFPGIPLKILFPELSITLIDSLDKRVKFLNAVIDALELEKISAVHGRVEDLAKNKDYREVFDFSTARAVAALPVLCEYCLPFVKVGGHFIALKSEKANEEINISSHALSVLGGEVSNISSFVLPDNVSSRSIIDISKVASTPMTYPRKAGTPSKKPL